MRGSGVASTIVASGARRSYDNSHPDDFHTIEPIALFLINWLAILELYGLYPGADFVDFEYSEAPRELEMPDRLWLVLSRSE